MIRLVAALLAPLVAVLGILLWTPGASPGHDLLSIANVGERPDAQVATAEGITVPDHSRIGTAASPSRSKTARRAVAVASLEVSIDEMAPSVIPARGPITMSGTVTNATDEMWRGLNVHPFTSYYPMTTAREIAVSAESDPEQAIGRRIVDPRAFVTIAELAPGETAHWTVRIPRDVLEIAGTQGVYWLGVHVLAANSQGRDDIADGRARSFIPLLNTPAHQVKTSLIVPVRRTTLRDADGMLAGADEWSTELAPAGRLRNIADFVDDADDAPLTWLVDPAVLDAVGQMADGNPPRDIEATTPPSTDSARTKPQADAAATRASEWLARIKGLTAGQRVLGLPYGDVDVAAAARYDADLFSRSRTLAKTSFEGYGITTQPAVVPPSGLLPSDALSVVPGGTTVLLSREALPSELAQETSPPTTITVDGRLVGVYDEAAASGGPGPDPRFAPVALRQRILAEAAVRSMADDPSPLIVTLPYNFDPGPLTDGFFDGLQRPFVRLAPTGMGSAASADDVDTLEYPQRQVDRELDASVFAAADELITAGETLDNLLVDNDTVGRTAARQALGTASYLVRDDPYTAAISAQSGKDWIKARLAKVSIEAPSFVILSSGSGPFAVTITNELDQPVSMKIQAHTEGGLVIKAPETIALDADSKQTVNLTASADSIGVHPVRLVATDDDGRPLGSVEEINVRSNKVGRVIWVILGGGVGILFLAILVRLVRRVRGRGAA